MKIAVIGATGLIGSTVVDVLEAAGHDVVGAARRTGLDVLTGQGLPAVLSGADIVVDVINSPSLDDEPVLAFFTAASANIVAAAKTAGVQHYVALSIVGVAGMAGSGYMKAKLIQEKTITASGLPYTIVRATQFHEFAEIIVGSLTVDGVVRAPDARIQPIAAAEVAAEVAAVAQAAPIDDIIDIGGPEKMTFAAMATSLLGAQGRDTTVVVDPEATYFGIPVDDDTLVTGPGAVIADIRFEDWLATR